MVRRILSESLEIDLSNELRQRKLPAFLAVICQSAEFFGVHSELASHLDVRVREAKSLACIDPGFQLVWNTLLGHVRSIAAIGQNDSAEFRKNRKPREVHNFFSS